MLANGYFISNLSQVKNEMLNLYYKQLILERGKTKKGLLDK